MSAISSHQDFNFLILNSWENGKSMCCTHVFCTKMHFAAILRPFFHSTLKPSWYLTFRTMSGISSHHDFDFLIMNSWENAKNVMHNAQSERFYFFVPMQPHSSLGGPYLFWAWWICWQKWYVYTILYITDENKGNMWVVPNFLGHSSFISLKTSL